MALLIRLLLLPLVVLWMLVVVVGLYVTALVVYVGGGQPTFELRIDDP